MWHGQEPLGAYRVNLVFLLQRVLAARPSAIREIPEPTWKTLGTHFLLKVSTKSYDFLIKL